MIEKYVVSKRNLEGVGLSGMRFSLFWLAFPVSVILLACVLIIVLINGVVSHDAYWMSQQELFLQLNDILSFVPSAVWASITLLGDASVLLPLLFLITIRVRQAWMAMLGSIPFAVLSSALCKKLAAMPRPAAVLDTNDFSIIGGTLSGYNSLPSGHTIAVFAASVAILVTLIPQFNKRREIICVALGLLLAGVVGLSRIAVGAHWPLDVLMGAGIGALAGLSGAVLALRRKWYALESTQGRGIVLLLLTALSGSLVFRIVENTSSEMMFWLAVAACFVLLLHLLLEEKVSIKVVVLKHKSI